MTSPNDERGNGMNNAENIGLHAAKSSPPSVISHQLRDELIRILTTGDDKHEGAFTIAIAVQIEKFAVAAREILMTEKLAKNDLASLTMMRGRHPWNGYIGGGPLLPSIYSDDGMAAGTPIVNNENFGVQAIRQIVDAVRTMGESPAKLVEALAAARSHNLTDVAAVLEKKLGVSATGSEDAVTERPIPTLPDGRPLQ